MVYSKHLIVPVLYFSDEVIVLSASGTAAKVNLMSDVAHHMLRQQSAPPISHYEKVQVERDRDKRLFVDVNLANQVTHNRLFSSVDG